MTTAIEVRERPILFSSQMVCAILDGRKTQTRRIVAKSNSETSVPWDWLEFDSANVPDGTTPLLVDNGYLHVPTRPHPDDPQGGSYWTRNRVYPRYEVGDRLWVREAWNLWHADAESTWKHPIATAENQEGVHVHYAADGRWEHAWRPSIHMPRWASRILLEVTEVRVQKLQEISEEDADAEGVCVGLQGSDDDFSQICFRELWEKINGKGSWESNPWVWCVSFKRVTP